jgi:hypothetical protein
LRVEKGGEGRLGRGLGTAPGGVRKEALAIPGRAGPREGAVEEGTDESGSGGGD